MMLIPSFLLFLAISGGMADVQEDWSRCRAMIDIDSMREVLDKNLREEFGAYCTKFQDFFSCLGEMAKKHTGLSLEELAKSKASFSTQVQLVLNVKNVVDEVCTEGTPLNTDFMAVIDCFSELGKKSDADCESRADAMYDAYIGFKKAGDGSGNEGFETGSFCMKTGYHTACVASQIHDTCGQLAFNTFNTMFKRISPFSFFFCSPEALENLKDSAVHGLGMNENEKEFFRLYFDLK